MTMDWIDDSDWNASARFVGRQGDVLVDAHVRGSIDEVTIEPVPGPHREELLVLFRSRDGADAAAFRVRDLLALTLQHYPELLEEVRLRESPADKPAP